MAKTIIQNAVRREIKDMLSNVYESLRQHALTIGIDLNRVEALRNDNTLSKVGKRDLRRLGANLEAILAEIQHSCEFLEITRNCYSDDSIIDLLESVEEQYGTE